MRSLTVLLLVTATSLPAAAQQTPTRDALVASLSGFESQPDEATVRAWGPASVQTLAAIIADEDVMVAARARAAYALRVYIATPAAASLLQRLAGDASGNLFVRLAAIDALAVAGGPLAPVTAALASSDPDLRAGAASSLAHARDLATARAALSARAAIERDATVLQRVRESLRRISPATR